VDDEDEEMGVGADGAGTAVACGAGVNPEADLRSGLTISGSSTFCPGRGSASIMMGPFTSDVWPRNFDPSPAFVILGADLFTKNVLRFMRLRVSASRARLTSNTVSDPGTIVTGVAVAYEVEPLPIAEVEGVL
jgi:hypothetical protein